MPFSRWVRAYGPVVLFVWAPVSARAAEPPLDAEGYIAIVLRSHPAAAQAAALEVAAQAERKAARLFPDPFFEHSRDRSRPTGEPGRLTETSYSASQTIPWPGTFTAGIRAGDRAADSLSAQAIGLRWELGVLARETFAQLVAARSRLDIGRAAEADARSLRDLVTRRADLGESRESDRIKAEVEWLRQNRSLAAAEREEGAAEAIFRALAVAPLPTPLDVAPPDAAPPPAIDRDMLRARLVDENPRQRAARAEAERQQALLSVARRARIPDLDLSVFRDKEIDKDANGFSLRVKVPLWNANRGEIARAQAAAQVSAAERDRTRLELLAELEGRLKELEIAAAQAAMLDGQILPAAERSVGLARLSYEEGETSLLDLLDAQRTYREAQREAAEAHFALSLAFAGVQRLVGPDFNPWRSR